MESIKIAVVDDHRLVREGLTLLLKSKGFQLVFSASTGKQAIVLMGRVTFSPDVILMDINMPEMNGYAACEKIHESYPECKILMLSSYTGPAFVGKAGRCNCHGFLSKGSSVESLVNAIQEVHQNGVYLNEFLNEKDF